MLREIQFRFDISKDQQRIRLDLNLGLIGAEQQSFGSAVVSAMKAPPKGWPRTTVAMVVFAVGLGPEVANASGGECDKRISSEGQTLGSDRNG